PRCLGIADSPCRAAASDITAFASGVDASTIGLGTPGWHGGLRSTESRCYPLSRCHAKRVGKLLRLATPYRKQFAQSQKIPDPAVRLESMTRGAGPRRQQRTPPPGAPVTPVRARLFARPRRACCLVAVATAE